MLGFCLESGIGLVTPGVVRWLARGGILAAAWLIRLPRSSGCLRFSALATIHTQVFMLYSFAYSFSA